ncbi:MAG TPA: thymidylate kinase, partial [Rhodobiaceae bacterium]|nr:thymidylate kinase [Rhodobiaceae bacterium]
EAGLQRAEKRGGAARFEKKGATFHQTLRDGFLALANEAPHRIVLIDGEDTFDNVWGQIEAELGRRFKL